jgi:hypothetical protein
MFPDSNKPTIGAELVIGKLQFDADPVVPLAFAVGRYLHRLVGAAR